MGVYIDRWTIQFENKTFFFRNLYSAEFVWCSDWNVRQWIHYCDWFLLIPRWSRCRCVNRNAQMVCSECPMVPVGFMRNRAVPAGRPAHLQRPQRRTAAGFGRSGRRRGHFRFRPDHSRRPGEPETQVSENQQTIASGAWKIL